MATVEEVQAGIGEFTEEAAAHGNSLRELSEQLEELKQKLGIITQGSTDGRTDQAVAGVASARERLIEAVQALVSAVENARAWAESI